DLPNYPLMMLEEVSNSRRYISRYAEENGVVLNPILEIGSLDLLIDFAKINLGVTYVIRELTRELVENKLYEIPVRPPVPKRSIGMVRLKNVAMSHALQGFIELMHLPKK
ncbi:MAG: LysR family transcriptional regulator substrate-binding protein, partial [Anaerotignum sp.]|nr:LysR family transcriptional regulator substrate-binding protein [Anaerotignum sp.]